MKRNTKFADIGSESEIWHYKCDRQLKCSKLRRSGQERTKLLNKTDSGIQKACLLSRYQWTRQKVSLSHGIL